MRPRGEVREALVEALRSAPGYPAELADRIGIEVGRVRYSLDTMCRANEVIVLRDEPVPWSNRPVRVYGLVEADEAPPIGASSFDWSLIDRWSAFPDR